MKTDLTLAQRLSLSGIYADKSLGQHFLLNPEISRTIVSKAGNLSEVNVIEIGPGPGGLTEAILQSQPKSLTVIEKDQHFVEFLTSLEKKYINFKIISADAMTFDYGMVSAPKVVIANLPYNISTQLIYKWLENLQEYSAFYLMLQKEVVKRICSEPGTKAYGKLSVLVQYQAKVKKVMDLSPKSFSPPPKVDSAVVEIIPNPVLGIRFFDIEKLCRLVFCHRRKKAYKALLQVFDDPQSIMNNIGIPINARAEDINVSQFVLLVQTLYNNS